MKFKVSFILSNIILAQEVASQIASLGFKIKKISNFEITFTAEEEAVESFFMTKIENNKFTKKPKLPLFLSKLKNIKFTIEE